MEDSDNKLALAKLLRFSSSKVDYAKGETTFLATYVANMKPDQEGIFFMAAGRYR